MNDDFDPVAYESSNLRKYRTNNWLYRKHIEQFQECLYELLSRSDPGSILDAGCGEGFIINYLKRRNPSLNVTGIDKSPEAVAYARQVMEVDAAFHTGDVYDLPFSDAAFDTVICSEVLEHLDHPGRALEELKRVAGNHVLITVPLEPLFQGINNVGQWLGLCPDPGHRQYWSQEDFKAFIRSHLEDPSFRKKHVYQLTLGKV